MSTKIFEYIPSGHTERSITFTRFYGGERRGMCLQVTIDDKLAVMDRKQVEELSDILKNDFIEYNKGGD